MSHPKYKPINVTEKCYLGSEKYFSGECYLDNSSRLLPHRTDYADNTPQKCISECRKKGFIYAGVEYGVNCFCGNQMPPDSALLEASECDYRCDGDHSQICGGRNWEMNVYSTG